MKKIIAVLMVFVLLAACSVFAFADGDEEVITGSCYRFKILNDEEASIVGFFGDGGYLHLDSSIGHRYITSVGTSAFEFNTNLINIRLNSRVKEIGDYAFHGCTELQRITIPASVQSIGKYAFQSCNDLEKICTSLESLEIPASVSEIGDYAFKDCPRLTLSVAEGSFAEQYAKEAEIPYTVTAE